MEIKQFKYVHRGFKKINFKTLRQKRNVMIMRHKGGRGISLTALEYSDRHNLCGGRFICKPKLPSTDSLSFCNAVGIITTENQ